MSMALNSWLRTRCLVSSRLPQRGKQEDMHGRADERSECRIAWYQLPERHEPRSGSENGANPGWRMERE